MIIKLLFTLLTFSVAAPTYAQVFDLEVTDYGGLDGTALQPFIDAEIKKAENEINKDLPSGAPDRLMEGMANTSVMAAKGIGTDYASNMSVFLIGGGVGVGADLEKPKGTDSDLSGAGVAPGVIMGLNLGFLDTQRILGMDTDRLNLYLNFMSYNYNKELGDKGEEKKIELDMLNIGMHFRYDWIQKRGSKLLGWGGVKFTFGYEYNKTKIGFGTKLNEKMDTTADTGERIQGTFTGNPTGSVLTSTQSIPLALSTDVQLLYILSIYTGIGLDYNMGEAKGKSDLNGNTSSLSCTGGALCGTSPTIRVKPTANLNTSAKVDPFIYRAFAGVQINLPYFRIFGQVDKSLGNDIIAATAGARFVF